jgi:sulfite reductase alpha subunit-like flavoprotein
MPQAVQQALVDAFATEGEMAVEDAKAFLAKLEKEGRYKQETW